LTDPLLFEALANDRQCHINTNTHNVTHTALFTWRNEFVLKLFHKLGTNKKPRIQQHIYLFANIFKGGATQHRPYIFPFRGM
jgi:hypothetical protein